MKLTAILLIAFLQVSAHGYSQEKISLHYKNIGFDKLFHIIGKKSDYSLLYKNEILPDKKVDVDLDNQPVPDVIAYLLQGTSLTCRLLSNKLIVITACITEVKNLPVKGQVTDSAGHPLAGVTVQIRGTAIGTVTDNNGRYSLMAPDNTVLVFSYLGYEKKEVAVNGRSEIDILLRPDEKRLSSVVVTALGIKREERALGYAVQEIKGEDLVTAREVNLVSALAGKVAGANIGSVSGPLGSSARIVIRGENSLTGDNQPLFVVDGIPIDNGMRANSGNRDYGNGAGEITPDNIETISILKGAAATALYGSRAAGGVVLITTKRGRSGKGLGISFNSTITFDVPVLRWKLQNEYGQGTGGVYAIGMGGRSWGPKFNPDTLIAQVDRTQFPLEGQKGALRPWVGRPDNIIGFFRTGKTYTNNIAYAGSSDKADYRISYTNLYQEAIAPNMSLKRNTFQFNTGYKITPKLEVRSSMSYINTNSPNRTGTGGRGGQNLMYSFLTQGRQSDLDRLKNYWVEGYEGLEQWSDNFRVFNNPYFSVYEITHRENKNRLLGNISLNYQFTPELSFMIRTGTDLYFTKTEDKTAYSAIGDRMGGYGQDNILFNERNSDFLLTYDKKISNNWTFNISAGGNQMYQRISTSSVSASQLNIPGIYNVGNVLGEKKGSNSLSRRKTNSLYGFVNISYKDLIYMDITGRNDWSSTLPPENNSYFYPSVSVSAILSDLLGIPSGSFLSFAKLRASFAQVGSDNIGPFELYQNFDYGNSWGGMPTLKESETIENEHIKPEIASNYELGADVRFFNDRLGVDLTYYNNISRNQILAINLAATSGYASKRINAGKIQSKGMEVVLSATPVKHANGFMWNVNLNWSANRSYVRELADGIDKYVMRGGGAASVEAHVDGLIGDLYSRILLRNEDGAVIYKKGLPQWTDDPVKVGNYNPKWMGGVSNQFSYKGVNLSVLFDVRYGGKIYSESYRYGRVWGEFEATLEGRDGIIGKGVMEDGSGHWAPNNVEIPGETYWGNDGGIMTRAAAGVVDASFIKCRELQIGYAIPAKVLKKIRLQKLVFSLVARNLFLLAKVPDIDPDNMQVSSQHFSPGGENIAFPETRSLGLNVQLAF